MGPGILGFALFAFWVYCIFDVIRADAASVQHLPKMFWVLIVIFIPTIGSLAWLLLGRPARPGTRLLPPPATPETPEAGRPSADHQKRRDEALRRHEAELERRRLEEEERRRDDPEDGA